MTKISDQIRRELLHHMQNGKVLDAIDLIIQNLIEELNILSTKFNGESTEELKLIIDKLGSRNDEYSQIISLMLSDSVFLPFNTTNLLKVQDGLAEIIELIQAFGHRWGIYPLNQWITDHLKSMILVTKSILSKLSMWIRDENSIILREVQLLENKADTLHREFVSRLYQEINDFKTFHLAEKLDSLLEEAVDRSEVLAKDLLILLRFNKISSSDLPSYLS